MYLRSAYLAAGPLAAPPASNGRADRSAIFHPDAPLVYGNAVGDPLVTGTGHGQPGIGKAPAQVRGFLAIVVMTKNGFAVDFLDMLAEKLGNVLVGRPVDRYAQLIAIDFFKFLFEILTVEPVVAEPVEIGELLVRKLIQFAVRAGGEGLAHEIVDIQRGQGHVLAFTRHKVGQGNHIPVSGVGSDEVGVVNPTIIEILARCPLGLELFNDIAFLDQIKRDLDAGDLFKGLAQHIGLILVGCDGLGHDLDIHSLKGLGRIDEPLHLLHLFLFCQRRRLKFLVDPLLGGCHVRACRAGKERKQYSHNTCQKQNPGPLF